ncbi:hypothetical protein Tco_1048400 [Tanacetum coccineum]
MEDEHLNTIPETESDEVIKSSVENLVPIPSESEDTSESDSDCDFPSCDDFSPINVSKEKSVTFSNPLFDSNDDFTSSDDESLSDEDVPEKNDIESKDSYVSNLDEPALLVTPLSDDNEVECFDPGGDVDEIEFLLHNEWKKILYDAPIDDLMTKDKVFDPGIPKKFFSPTYVSLPFEDGHYLSLTYVIRIFLPYFTYLVESPFLLSSGSEDTIFDPGISAFHFSSLEPAASHQSGTFILNHFVEISSGEIKVHIEVLSVLWENRLPIPDGSLPFSSTTDLWANGSTTRGGEEMYISKNELVLRFKENDLMAQIRAFESTHDAMELKDVGAENSFVYDPNLNSFNDPPNFFNHPPQPQTYSCELCGNDSHYGYDCQPRVPLVYEQEPGPHESFQYQPMNQNYFEPNPSYSGFDQPSQYPIDQSPPQEMSIQDVEYLKQQYLDEMKKLRQLKQATNVSTHTPEPSRRFNSIYYDDDDDEESTIPLNEIISQLPHVEDLVPIPSEFEDTSGSDSDCDLPSCNDFSPINILEEKSVTFSNPLFDSNDDFTSSDDKSLSDEDVPEDNVKNYSNPLFESDDEYISSNVNLIFDEVLENIESKDSYVCNFDEPALLVTPLSDAKEDECFDPGGDVDEIEVLLYHDPSTPKISVASILEGFIDELPLEENDDLFDLESKENEWKKILYDAPIDDLMTKDKVFNLGILEKFFSPTYVSLPFEDRHYLSLTYVI